jgi:hypothetical protein
LVKDILMPPIGLLTGGLDFSNKFLLLKDAPDGAYFATPADAVKAGAITWNYGNFTSVVINFIIVAFCIFLAACGDSLVLYEWDLNNDGTFDVTGATPIVSGAQLTSLGLVVGANTIKLRTTDTHATTNTGSGTLNILAEGAGCDDGVGCTSGETCTAGSCGGGTPGGGRERAVLRQGDVIGFG